MAIAVPGFTWAEPEADADDEAPVDESFVDAARDSVDAVLQGTVRRIDGFFVNGEFATFSDAKTRIRLRLNADYLQKHGWEFLPRIKLNLVLPGLNERLRIVVNDDNGGDDEQASQGDDSDNDLALRWVGTQSKRLGLSFDAGLRLRRNEPDAFGRINAGVDYPIVGSLTGQTTNRLYYYLQTGVRNDARQYLNLALGRNFLLRSRTRVQYFEENVYNPFVEQKLSLFHSLSDKTKFGYELLFRRQSLENSPFDEDEILSGQTERYDHYIVQLRYRQQFLRDWLFFEIWPSVVWPEERNFDAVLAARFRLEINFGGSGNARLDE